MKEAYVSYEIAKLLKEKRFDWGCNASFNVNSKDFMVLPKGKRNSIDGEKHYDMEHLPDNWIALPTQQMACRWLREEKGIHIYPTPVTGFYYTVSVYAEQGNKIYGRLLSRSGRHAYEEVIEAALEYCLTNLI